MQWQIDLNWENILSETEPEQHVYALIGGLLISASGKSLSSYWSHGEGPQIENVGSAEYLIKVEISFRCRAIVRIIIYAQIKSEACS